MKTLKVLSILLLFFVGVNALVAGCFFIVDPSGSMLGIGVDWLKHSPFNDFLIPGIVLFVLNGAVNLFTASGVVFNWKYYSDLIIVQGMVLILWIIVQAVLLQEMNSLHYLFATIGAVIMACGIRLKQMIINP